MNLLIDELPEAIEINGRIFNVNTDFRAALRVILAFDDNSVTSYEKSVFLLANLYPVVPDDIEQAIIKGIKFLNGGKDANNEELGDRLYSFSKDANYIFAAFRQTHGIDLETAHLHWWKFLALFMDLGAETTWSHIVGLRKRLKDGSATDYEKKMAADMGDVLRVPELDTKTIEEREQEREFMSMIGQNA